MEPAAVIVSGQQQLFADETIALPQMNVQLLRLVNPGDSHLLVQSRSDREGNGLFLHGGADVYL